MKKVFISIGLITAIVATILSVTKFSNLAVAPIIVAFISGLIVLFLSKKEQSKTKPIQYIFILIIISLSLTIYKGVINTYEIDKTEQLEPQNEENLNNSEVVIKKKQVD